jgi:uncharacterized membrane protein YqaE (UPF0057 family)
MKYNILLVVLSLLLGPLSVLAQGNFVTNHYNRTMPTFQALERVCSNNLDDIHVSDKFLDDVCDIVVKSDFCKDVEVDLRNTCSTQEEFSFTDTAISCLTGAFSSMKELWSFLKSAVGLIIDPEQRKTASEEGSAFLESLSTYYEVEKVKTKEDMWGPGKDLRAGIISGSKLFAHIINNFILKPLKSQYDKLACYNSKGKTQSICKLITDIFFPPVAILTAIKKGPKAIMLLVKGAKALKKSTSSKITQSGDTVPMKRPVPDTLPTVKNSPDTLPTRKLPANESATVKFKVKPKFGNQLKHVKPVVYDFGGIKYVETKPFGKTAYGSSFASEAFLKNSKLKPLGGKDFNVREMKLKSAEVEKIDGLGGGITSSYLITFKDGSKGVFKPKDPGQWASNYRTEVLSYQVDKAFGFDLIPETVERTIKGKHGSLQRFKQGDMGVEVDPTDINVNAYNKQKVMDFLLDHRDRHGGNYLVTKKGNIVSIDNSLSFTGRGHNYSELPMIEERMVNFMTSTEGKAIMKRMKKTDRKKLAKDMEEYIGPADTNRFLDRLDFLVKYNDRLME